MFIRKPYFNIIAYYVKFINFTTTESYLVNCGVIHWFYLLNLWIFGPSSHNINSRKQYIDKLRHMKIASHLGLLSCHTKHRSLRGLCLGNLVSPSSGDWVKDPGAVGCNFCCELSSWLAGNRLHGGKKREKDRESGRASAWCRFVRSLIPSDQGLTFTTFQLTVILFLWSPHTVTLGIRAFPRIWREWDTTRATAPTSRKISVTVKRRMGYRRQNNF